MTAAHVTAVFTGTDPTAATDYLLTGFSDGHFELALRPIGADGWTAWSPPVSMTPMHEWNMPEAMHEGMRHP